MYDQSVWLCTGPPFWPKFSPRVWAADGERLTRCNHSILSDCLNGQNTAKVQPNRNIYYYQATQTTRVARLWTPRVSPRRNHKFHGGGVHRAGNIRDILCFRLPLRSRGDRHTNKQTHRQTGGQHHRVKPPLLQAGVGA